MKSFRIVTPTLNAGWMLEETARSVLASLSPNDRYIIVDGGSTDGSVEALRKWVPSNVEFRRDSGGGIYDAISTGFRDCDEPLMAWINASDIYLAGSLDWVRAEFERTQAQLLHFDDLYIDNNSKVICRSRGTVKHTRTSVLDGWTPLQDGCFWTHALYCAIGGVNDRWKIAGDFDFFLRAFQRGGTAYGRGVVSAFRQHEGQLSRAKSKEYSEECRMILQLYGENEMTPFMCRIIRRMLLSVQYRSGSMRIATPFVFKDARTVPASP